MSIVIREFLMEDLAQVSIVVCKSLKPSLANLSEDTQLQILERNYPSNFIKGRESIEYWVAEENQKVVGIIGLDNNEVRTFYVEPLYQGKGIGRLLYNKVKEISLQRNKKELTVRSSIEAVDIYKHLGFKEIEKIYKKYPDENISFTVLMTSSLI